MIDVTNEIGETSDTDETLESNIDSGTEVTEIPKIN
jgi:hypothetical protein